MNQTVKTNRRILIVDDQEPIHADFRKILSAAGETVSTLDRDEALLFGEPTPNSAKEDFEIDSAFQGEQGLALVQQSIEERNPYAVAFIDVRMPPGWDGVETTERIWEVDPHLQVVLCTAQSNYTWQETVDRLGRTDRLLILKKPFDSFTVRQFATSLTKKWCLVRELNDQLNRFRAQIEQTRRIIDTSNDAFVSFDEDDHIIEWSRQAELLFGRSRDQILDRPLTNHLLPLSDESETLESLKRDLIGRGEGRRCRMTARHRDGRLFPVELSLSFMQVDETLIFNAFIHDVAEKEREHKRALHAQKMQSVGVLAAGIANGIDLRIREVEQQLSEMLRAINGLELFETSCRSLVDACEGIQHSDGETHARQTIEAVQKQLCDPSLSFFRANGQSSAEQSLRQINEVGQIVGALHQFSHPGGDEPAAVDLNQFVASAVCICQGSWQDKVDFEMKLDFELPLVICRPVELNQAILYVILNSTEAVMRSGVETGRKRHNIWISTQCESESVVLQIGDDGPTFAQQDRAHLFSQPLPCESGRSAHGLPLAGSIIAQRHFGKIQYDTDAPYPSTFTIRLPLQTESTSTKPLTFSGEQLP